MSLSQAGGAIPDADTFAYVGRDFESECFRLLSAGTWVVLVGPRQHGKTSGLVRVAHQLERGGIPSAFVDMQAFASTTSSYSDLLGWLAGTMASALGVPPAATPSRAAEDLEGWLEGCMPAGRGTVALILDEAAAIPEAHRTRFFSQMRAIFNSRATSRSDSIGNRLVVVFSGTFDPEELISGENSPFNICERLETADLSRDEVIVLSTGILGEDLGPVAGARIHAICGGQPYLAQTAIQCVQRLGVPDLDAPMMLFRERHLSGLDGHLPSLVGQFSTDAASMNILRQLVQGFPVLFSPIELRHRKLRVAGICRSEGEFLKIRNTLYEDFLHAVPETPSLSGDDPAPPALALDLANFSKLQDPNLREVASDAYTAGFRLLALPSKRIALSAFGASLEAILLDYALRFEPSDETKARAAIHRSSGQTAPANIERWKLYQLVDGVLAVYPISGGAPAAHTLRNWRNLIHPAVAMGEAAPADGYGPEAYIAANWIVAVLRDLPESAP